MTPDPSPEPTTFAGLVDRFLEVISVAVPALFAIIFIYFVWKVIDAWVIHGGDATKRQEGKQHVLIGVLVFVLMVTIWGIVALVRNTLFGA
jgi:hypothetical protein